MRTAEFERPIALVPLAGLAVGRARGAVSTLRAAESGSPASVAVSPLPGVRFRLEEDELDDEDDEDDDDLDDFDDDFDDEDEDDEWDDEDDDLDDEEV